MTLTSFGDEAELNNSYPKTRGLANAEPCLSAAYFPRIGFVSAPAPPHRGIVPGGVKAMFVAASRV